MTVLMPFYTPFYAPLAAGTALGHFREEGLDVRWQPAARFGKSAVEALLDGSIEITLSGLMRSFDVADRDGRFLPHFAEVCSRSGFFLLGRKPMPDFRWSDLAGKIVIGFAEAPTPWQCMLTVLRRHGVDPAAVRIERSRQVPEALATVRSGHGDFFEQTQPIVEQMLANGEAHLVASMGEATGPVPFTSYMTTPEFLRREPETVLRFTRAVYHTQTSTAGCSSARSSVSRSKIPGRMIQCSDAPASTTCRKSCRRAALSGRPTATKTSWTPRSRRRPSGK